VHTRQTGWIERFASHRLAANLLMVLMIMAGIWGAVKIACR
jgi:hypothetical protein